MNLLQMLSKLKFRILSIHVEASLFMCVTLMSLFPSFDKYIEINLAMNLTFDYLY